MELIVNLGPDTYPIYIENGILPQTGSYIRKFFTGKKIMLISDDHVFPLYGKTVLDSLKDYECHSLVLPHGEPTKSFQTLPQIYSAMLDARLTRSDLVIALGGGVIGDLAGFAASSFLRGVRLVQIPACPGRLFCWWKSRSRSATGEKSCRCIFPSKSSHY